MTKRLIAGTANERRRRIFVQPADGSMKVVSYGRIRLDKIEPEIRFLERRARDWADLPQRYL